MADRASSPDALAPSVTPGPRRKPPARLRQLDALRGVAILLVLGEHRHISDVWIRIGWTGVDLFFVLSGFLISGLLFTEYKHHKKINFRRFFVRRGLKIYPGYYVLLAYFLVRNLIQGRGASTYMLWQLVFLQNYAPSPADQPVDYTWTLAVEEHFYVLLPLCLILLLRAGALRSTIAETPDPFRRLPWIVLGIACVLPLLRALTMALLPYDIKTHHQATHLRIDSLLFGVLIGYFYHFHRSRLRQFVTRRRGWILVASCVCLLLGVIRPHQDPWTNVVGLSGLYVGYGGILLLVLPELSVPSTEGRVLAAVRDRLVAALAFVGTYSYAIYLWHPPVQSGGMRLVELVVGHLPDVVMFGIYVALSIAMGAFMTKAIEIPVLRWRDRLLPPRGDISDAARSG